MEYIMEKSRANEPSTKEHCLVLDDRFDGRQLQGEVVVYNLATEAIEIVPLDKLQRPDRGIVMIVLDEIEKRFGILADYEKRRHSLCEYS